CLEPAFLTTTFSGPQTNTAFSGAGKQDITVAATGAGGTGGGAGNCGGGGGDGCAQKNLGTPGAVTFRMDTAAGTTLT
ncbi:MAG TPA: hypothetical protein VH120_13885, partial [Gemmataceae bacterium]|nr:hypothetical protein [Gemmataceae bacterium]